MAHDGVEELRGERQRPGVGVDREDAVLDAGVPDALEVLGGAEPQVGGPDLHAELAAQEDRRHRPPAAEVQDPHAGPQVERSQSHSVSHSGLAPPLTPASTHSGVVTRGAGEPVGD